MSVELRYEQCCDTDGCVKPARFGDLCAGCFMAATPARRRVEFVTEPIDALELWWRLPAREPRRAA
jgi:hypothetical protein